MQRLNRMDWLWFFIFAIVSSGYCIATAADIGPTFDEPIYFRSGMSVWHSGSQAPFLRLGTMPLPGDVQTLPLFLWECCTGNQIDPQTDLLDYLFWMRLGNLIFWWLLLWYAGQTGRLLGGPWAGRLAIALVASETSLLTHAALATTDIAVTACLLALFYHYAVGRDQTWPRRVALPALCFGLAVSAKASAVVYGPICLLVIECQRLLAQRQVAWPPSPAMAGARRDLTWILFGGLAMTFVFCGSDFETDASFVKWAHELPAGRMADSMIVIAENLRIFSNAGEGLLRQVKHNVNGQGSFLMGQEAERAMWYYFPVLLTMKLSVALLMAPFILAAVRPRTLANWAFLAALAVFLVSPTFRVQLGIRMIFPILALAIVGLAVGMVAAIGTVQTRRWRTVSVLAVSSGIACMTATNASVWPNGRGLCYVNELWGGSARGYELVSDSNYDWGQGIPELLAWQRRHGESVDIWYFGSDPRTLASPFRAVSLDRVPDDNPEQIVTFLEHRYLAASTTMLFGSTRYCGGRHGSAMFLRNCRPVARTSTYLIFLREDIAEATRQVSGPREAMLDLRRD